MTTKFIRLTEIVRSGQRIRVINTSVIKTIEPSAKPDGDTHVKLMDETYFFIRENMDEVWAMLRPEL